VSGLHRGPTKGRVQTATRRPRLACHSDAGTGSRLAKATQAMLRHGDDRSVSPLTAPSVNSLTANLLRVERVS
jgi:hypothetical protein